MQFKQPTPFGQPAPPEEAPRVSVTPDVAAAVEKFEADKQTAAQTQVEKVRVKARRDAVRAVEAEEVAARRVVALRASEVDEERGKWLWKNRIPLGEVTLLAGRGNVGKSTVAAQLVAWVTRGEMFGEFFAQPRNVILVINEDSIKKTVIPRLKAAGADLDRVFIIRMRVETGETDRIKIPDDIDNLEAVIRANDVAFVVFDPLSSNLSGKKNDGDDMRPVLEKMNALAGSTACAILGLAHVRKGHSQDLIEGIMGSSELANVVRAAMGVVPDPDEDGAIILSQEKSNLGRMDIESFRYKIHTYEYEADNGEQITTSHLEWLSATDTKASDVLADRAAGGDGSNHAVDWLRGHLMTEGPQTRAECIKAARSKEIGARSIDRARKILRVKSVRSAFGGEATWELPSD